jgi:hypothetical protein
MSGDSYLALLYLPFSIWMDVQMNPCTSIPITRVQLPIPQFKIDSPVLGVSHKSASWVAACSSGQCFNESAMRFIADGFMNILLPPLARNWK